LIRQKRLSLKGWLKRTMFQNKRIMILGSGSSIRQNLWDVPIQWLPIWQAFNNEVVFSLNWGFKFFKNLTVEIYSDYQFYAAFKEELDKLPLIISTNDGAYLRKNGVKLSPNVITLQGANEYNGEESWNLGFFSKQLCGILALNLAIRLGFGEIFLLGFDANEINGYTHFFQDDGVTGHYVYDNQQHNGVGRNKNGDYRTGNYNRIKELNEKYFDPFKEDLKRGIRIFNVSPNSAINSFQKMDYSQFYKILKENKQIINQDVVRNEIKRIINEKS